MKPRYKASQRLRMNSLVQWLKSADIEAPLVTTLGFALPSSLYRSGPGHRLCIILSFSDSLRIYHVVRTFRVTSLASTVLFILWWYDTHVKCIWSYASSITLSNFSLTPAERLPPRVFLLLSCLWGHWPSEFNRIAVSWAWSKFFPQCQNLEELWETRKQTNKQKQEEEKKNYFIPKIVYLRLENRS